MRSMLSEILVILTDQSLSYPSRFIRKSCFASIILINQFRCFVCENPTISNASQVDDRSSIDEPPTTSGGTATNIVIAIMTINADANHCRSQGKVLLVYILSLW